jgi:hypothetical protein
MNDLELIAKAKATLVEKPKATKENTKSVEAIDAQLMNELLALRATIDEQIKALTAEKKNIDDIVKDAIGTRDELTVHGAKVASIARWRETRVLSDVVKEMFAVADYPELYKRESKSRLTIH